MIALLHWPNHQLVTEVGVAAALTAGTHPHCSFGQTEKQTIRLGRQDNENISIAHYLYQFLDLYLLVEIASFTHGYIYVNTKLIAYPKKQHIGWLGFPGEANHFLIVCNK
jgi:hypothetical protein